MAATEKEVHQRLDQLHAVIDALQEKVLDAREGRKQNDNDSLSIIRSRYERLSVVLSKISGQNVKLHGENNALKQSNNLLVKKISALESRLHQMAEKEANTGIEAWLRQTSLELRNFLEVNGLEHFSSPRFSPVVAGLVSNGVLLLPVAMSSLFLLNYAKQLTVLRMLMATNLFEVGVGVAMIVSSVLLLGDPLEGMRHISEANFVFIQIVLASVFWIAMGLLVVSASQTWRSRAWRYCACEILLKCIIAMIYTWQVWIPAMNQGDTPIRLAPPYYMMFITCSFACLVLTARASQSWMFCKPRSREGFHNKKNFTVSVEHLERNSEYLPFRHTD